MRRTIDPWKPTRQLRSCVIYDNSEVLAAARLADELPTKAARKRIPIQPLGLFSLINTVRVAEAFALYEFDPLLFEGYLV